MFSRIKVLSVDLCVLLLLFFFYIVVVQPVRSGIQYKSVISGSGDLKATSASFVFDEGTYGAKEKNKISSLPEASEAAALILSLSR